MQITNEEMEALNRASEILSKYAAQGGLARTDFEHYERMVIAIIDEHGSARAHIKTEDWNRTLFQLLVTLTRVKEKMLNAENNSIIRSASDPDLFSIEPYRDGVVISGYNGFKESNIKTVIIPQNIHGKQVLALAEKAFFNVNDITAVYVPEGVVSIGDSCFESCSLLNEIHLPTTLKAIGYRAFCQTNIEHITIPDSVFYIGSAAFEDTPIQDIILPSSLYVVSDGMFGRCKRLEKVVIREGCNAIGGYAFSYCSRLSHVFIPAGLTTIRNGAFSYCSGLKALEVPNTVISIGENSFSAGAGRQGDITIFCAPGSYAQRYARENGLKMKSSLREQHFDYVLNHPVLIVSAEDYWSMRRQMDLSSRLGKKYTARRVISEEDEARIEDEFVSVNGEWIRTGSSTGCVKVDQEHAEEYEKECIACYNRRMKVSIIDAKKV